MQDIVRIDVPVKKGVLYFIKGKLFWLYDGTYDPEDGDDSEYLKGLSDILYTDGTPRARFGKDTVCTIVPSFDTSVTTDPSFSFIDANIFPDDIKDAIRRCRDGK